MTLAVNREQPVFDRFPAPPPEAPSDEILARRAGEGDEDAFAVLVERHQDRVYRLALRMVSNPSDAEEIVQEAFLNAYRGLATFRGDAKFGTWLYQIVVNGALAQQRSARRRPTLSLDDHLPRFDEHGALAPGLHGLAARADELLDRKRLREHLLAALARLDEHHRTVFVLRDLEGLSTEEVADIFAICETAVRQRLHRARLQLRGLLSEALRPS